MIRWFGRDVRPRLVCEVILQAERKVKTRERVCSLYGMRSCSLLIVFECCKIASIVLDSCTAVPNVFVWIFVVSMAKPRTDGT